MSGGDFGTYCTSWKSSFRNCPIALMRLDLPLRLSPRIITLVRLVLFIACTLPSGTWRYELINFMYKHQGEEKKEDCHQGELLHKKEGYKTPLVNASACFLSCQ